MKNEATKRNASNFTSRLPALTHFSSQHQVLMVTTRLKIAVAPRETANWRLMGYLPEATAVEIIHGLDNFLLAVHHEWTVTGNGLIDGFAT